MNTASAGEGIMVTVTMTQEGWQSRIDTYQKFLKQTRRLIFADDVEVMTVHEMMRAGLAYMGHNIATNGVTPATDCAVLVHTSYWDAMARCGWGAPELWFINAFMEAMEVRTYSLIADIRQSIAMALAVQAKAQNASSTVGDTEPHTVH